MPADWELAAADAISLAALAEQPFIRPPQRYVAQYAPPEAGSYAAFKSVGVMPRVTQEATQTNTSLSLVGAGLGGSRVMATAARTGAPNVRLLPLSDRGFNQVWELVMAWLPNHLGKLAQEFVAFVQDHVAANPRLLDPGVSILP